MATKWVNRKGKEQEEEKLGSKLFVNHVIKK